EHDIREDGGCCAVLLTSTTLPASATIISGTYDITATNFSPNQAPIATVIASFTLSFDNSSQITDTSAGLVVNSLNIPVDGSVEYFYKQSTDTLIIGGSANGGPTG